MFIPALSNIHYNAELLEVLWNSDIDECRLIKLTIKHQPHQLLHINLQVQASLIIVI